MTPYAESSPEQRLSNEASSRLANVVLSDVNVSFQAYGDDADASADREIDRIMDTQGLSAYDARAKVYGYFEPREPIPVAVRPVTSSVPKSADAGWSPSSVLSTMDAGEHEPDWRERQFKD